VTTARESGGTEPGGSGREAGETGKLARVFARRFSSEPRSGPPGPHGMYRKRELPAPQARRWIDTGRPPNLDRKSLFRATVIARSSRHGKVDDSSGRWTDPLPLRASGRWSETIIGMTARWCPRHPVVASTLPGDGDPDTGFAAPAVNTAHPGKSATGYGRCRKATKSNSVGRSKAPESQLRYWLETAGGGSLP